MPGGVKLVLPLSNGAPPVAVAYQSTVSPAPTLTVRAGVFVPSQMTEKLGLLGGAMVGQLQLGALTVI